VKRGDHQNKTKLSPEALADLALDGDAPLDAALSRDHTGRTARHVRAVRRLERLLRLEARSKTQPDFTAAVLEEVGVRRGWLDERSRRMVWVGRGLAAAALLAAFAAFLGVRRAAPELTAPSRGAPAALASVVEASERAASGATAPLAGVMEMIDGGRPVLVQVGATIGRRAEAAPHAPEAPRPARVYTVRLEDWESAAPARSPKPAPAVFADSSAACGAAAQASLFATLDAASRRTVSAVVGLDRTPRWLRAKTFPAGEPSGSWE